jgi:hypothetical protein
METLPGLLDLLTVEDFLISEVLQGFVSGRLLLAAQAVETRRSTARSRLLGGKR